MGGFTPRLSLVPPAGLLLDIGGCLRLWGGLERIVTAVVSGLDAQGYVVTLAVAPTPQAALWLASGAPSLAPTGTKNLCTDVASMRGQLDALPVANTDLPAPAREKLQRFGVHTLGDARRLPRDGLTRRIGSDAVMMIARAYGEIIDLRPEFVFPESFSQSLELPAAVELAGALRFAAHRLMAALAGWLAVRQSGLDECVLELAHSAHEATHLVLRFAEATRDLQRFERVLRERLERLPLTAPVVALRLRADSVAALPGTSGALFGGATTARTAMAALVERLRARLGEERVYGLACHADHRPECATRKVATASATAHRSSAMHLSPRPFWLLDPPEALPEVGGRPWRRGALRLLAGPERIESGWWEVGEMRGENEIFSDVRRDYFVAITADSRWAWVFRELRVPGGWYLHGWFS